MADWTLPIEAACLCGAVRLSVSAPPLLTLACHCTGCQKLTASAFSLSAAFPKDAVEVVAGEPELGGMKRDDVQQYFCPSCKSWLYSRMEFLPVVNVRTTMLEDPSRFAPFAECWTDEKLAFAETGAGRSYPGFPSMEDFEELTKAYPAR